MELSAVATNPRSLFRGGLLYLGLSSGPVARKARSELLLCDWGAMIDGRGCLRELRSVAQCQSYRAGHAHLVSLRLRHHGTDWRSLGSSHHRDVE